MIKREYLALARQLMDEHGLKDWRIASIRSKNTAGQCVWLHKTLRFSDSIFTVWSEDKVRNTILHEIAHALAGPGNGHNSKWRHIFLSIGGNGKTRWSDEDAQASLALWIGVCPNGHQAYRNARSKKMVHVSCAKCSKRYDDRYLFVWTNQKTGEVVKPPANIDAMLDFYSTFKRLTTPVAADSVKPRSTEVHAVAVAAICPVCFTTYASNGSCNCV